MGRAGRPLLALAALCWAPWEASGDGSAASVFRRLAALVTQEDIDFADSIKAVDERACGHPLLGGVAWLAENHLKVAESPEKLLAEFGGKNSLKENLATGEFDSNAYVSDVVSRGVFVLPLYLAIFMCFAFCVTCCQVRFQCCRCRSKKRVFGKRIKLIIWFVLSLLLYLIVYESLFEAWKGIAEVEVGLEAFACGATELVHVTFNGHQEEPTFPGTISVLRDMENLTKFLDEGSDFQKELDPVIDKIGEMYKAAVPALAAMELLNGKNWAHLYDDAVCPLCKELSDQVKLAKDEFEVNSGYILATQATKDLKPGEEDKQKILDGVSAATGPLKKLQEQARGAGEGLANNIEEMVDSTLPTVQTVMFVMTTLNIGSALLLVCCGAKSAFEFTFRETVKQQAEAAAEPEAEQKEEEATKLVEEEPKEFNPYNPNVQFWASRTWCWGFCYCIITLFIGAFVSTALVPVGESCMLLTELKRDSSTIDDFGSAIPDPEQAKKIIDGCLINANGDEALLMDILETPGAEENYALRKKLANDVSKSMEDVFSDLITYSEAPYEAPYVYMPPMLVAPEMTKLLAILMRDEATLIAGLANSGASKDWECPLFTGLMTDECDPQASNEALSCMDGQVGDDYEALEMHENTNTCNRTEFAKYLQGFVGGPLGGGRLEVALIDFNSAVIEHKDNVKTEFQRVWDGHVDKAVDELSDKTDCRYIGIYYKQLVTGLCAQAVVGINDMVGASLWSGYFALALTISMYLLWRMALDNYDHHKDLAPEEVQAALEEEDRLRAEADRSNWVLTSGLKEEDKGIDPSLIPESVRARNELASDDSFGD